MLSHLHKQQRRRAAETKSSRDDESTIVKIALLEGDFIKIEVESQAISIGGI